MKNTKAVKLEMADALVGAFFEGTRHADDQTMMLAALKIFTMSVKHGLTNSGLHPHIKETIKMLRGEMAKWEAVLAKDSS